MKTFRKKVSIIYRCLVGLVVVVDLYCVGVLAFTDRMMDTRTLAIISLSGIVVVGAFSLWLVEEITP